ncbi:Beta-1,3-galactosyl-O-glycosyl-glycoprotein beta-1,6-N-acetylglucosaminyltransferase 3 [Aphelenchoides bicaudatus]|nr:Beta-1,3-galactosyl-O-glycosyl-glycoprotein beta-1,6-N-acetylglucosaminyltransferase 3 [Aphelenchoides bicaudatus]
MTIFNCLVGLLKSAPKLAGTVAGLTRYNIWSSSRKLCDGQRWRHDICIFGLEALQPKLSNNSFFFANKMIPNVDFGAIVCWNEMLFNRTHHDRGIHRLNKSDYVNLPHVRFNHAKQKYGASFNITRFNCAKYVKDHIGTNILAAGNKKASGQSSLNKLVNRTYIHLNLVCYLPASFLSKKRDRNQISIISFGYRDSPTFTLKFHKRPVHFKRPNVTQHIPCHKFFQSQLEHGYLAKKFRINYTDPANEKDFPTDCASIFARNNFYMKPMSKEENEFPLAYARNVNKDYHFIEMLLSTTYAPQNLYCYSIDGKADKLFRKRMHDLAKCFPNIYITNFNATMDKLGHNTNAHHMSCLEWLNDKKKQWKYVMILQTHDLPLKTNQEMIQILKWYNGTNDVTTQVRKICMWYECFPWDKHDWNFTKLQIFKDSARNNLVVNGHKPELTITRSLIQNAMSRKAIEFMFDTLNLTTTIEQLNSNPGTMTDEILFSSLNSNDNIQLPGGFTTQCDSNVGNVVGMSRFNIWSRNKQMCRSQLWRHELCIFGLEDLSPNLANNPYFFANKITPEYDFGAIVCWNEMLFNRTYFDRGFHRLNKKSYTKLPQVRYNKAKHKYGDDFDFENFDCEKYEDDYIGTEYSPNGILNLM